MPIIPKNILLINVIIPTKPISIAHTITPTLKPSKIYSPSISKKDCLLVSATTRISSSGLTS